MTPLHTLLTDDHRHCDEMLAEVEEILAGQRDGDAQAAFQRFCDATLAHFAFEEEALFPAFEAATGITQGPTQVMRQEHALMRRQLPLAAQALADGALDDYHGAVDSLLIFMQQHNMKEENVLYPMCDANIGSAREGLLARFHAVRPQ